MITQSKTNVKAAVCDEKCLTSVVFLYVFVCISYLAKGLQINAIYRYGHQI